MIETISGWKDLGDDRHESVPDGTFIVFREPYGKWTAIESGDKTDRIVLADAESRLVAMLACENLVIRRIRDERNGRKS